MADSESLGLRKFVPSLEAVAQAFSVPVRAVREWRDADCPALKSKPYDLNSINNWLSTRSDKENNPSLEIGEQKLTAELQQLKTKNAVLSKDKSFWLAAGALGIALSNHVKNWLPANSRTESLQPAILRIDFFWLSIEKGTFDKAKIDEAKLQILAFENSLPNHFFCFDADADVELAKVAKVIEKTATEFDERLVAQRRFVVLGPVSDRASELDKCRRFQADIGKAYAATRDRLRLEARFKEINGRFPGLNDAKHTPRHAEKQKRESHFLFEIQRPDYDHYDLVINFPRNPRQ